MQLPELVDLLKTIEPHDLGLLLLSALAAGILILLLTVCCQRPAPATFDSALRASGYPEAEEQAFWLCLFTGPCRLTEREINRKAEQLAKIRTPGEFGDITVFSQARREILQHVGRAT